MDTSQPIPADPQGVALVPGMSHPRAGTVLGAGPSDAPSWHDGSLGDASTHPGFPWPFPAPGGWDSLAVTGFTGSVALPAHPAPVPWAGASRDRI